MLQKVQIIGIFILKEILLKTAILLLITTFAAFVLISFIPEEKEIQAPIRSSDVSEPQPEFTPDGISETGQSGALGYIPWLWSLFRGDFGRVVAGQKIIEEIRQKFLVTAFISFSALIPALALSFVFGVLYQCLWIKRLSSGFLLLTSLPPFFLGYLLLALCGFSFSSVRTYFLAILTLGLSSGIINEFSRIIKNSMELESTKEYVETAIVKGLKSRLLPLPGSVEYHIFRNAIISIVPRIGVLFGIIISSSMVVEQVFDVPGLSYMLLEGLASIDKGRILIVIFLAVILARMGAISSLILHACINPRYGKY